MRGLMNVLKLVLIVAGIKTIRLYIEKANPYLEKALALYREKGFKKVTSKYNDSFTLDCSL
jgi:ribosomal protein S18 acetylase RimI-like enzyme